MNAIFNAFDLSNVQEMRFHLAQPVANAYEATKLFLAALKDKGYALSKNLFLLLGEEALEHQTRAIIEAGSHYIILVNNLLGYKRKPTVQQLRSKNIVGCQYVFSSLEELAPYTTLPLTDMASITHRANFVVTSLEVAADDNATKIICTLDETYIFSKLAREAEEIQKLILQNKEHLLNLIASRQAQALGLHLVKQAFDEFVLSKLQEPAEFELVKAVLQERSKRRKVKLNKDIVPVVLREDDLFLHFFALFCQPLLAQLKEAAEAIEASDA